MSDDGAKIIMFADAVARMAGRDPNKARLRMSIDKDADMLVRINNGQRWAVPSDQVEGLLLLLLRRHRAVKARNLGLLVKRKADPKRRDICRRERDGGLGVIGHGCRRDRGHKGQCSDKRGRYTPALCLHVGRGVTMVHDIAKNTHRAHCRHCNADIGPCDSSMGPFGGM